MHVNQDEFKRHLWELARGAGAVTMGVCRPGRLEDVDRLHGWLASGRHGGMSYLEETAEIRADPRHLVPGVRSILVVAVPYALSPSVPDEGGAARREAAGGAGALDAALLAGLFVGQDYHAVLRQLLEPLRAACLRAGGRPEHTRVAVDTEPLLERSLAVRAGVGQVGRSRQLLVPGVGSRVVLGVLLTDLELPPDSPAAGDPCGGCRACLRACPGGALSEEDGLDARRCLSYATTASRESIPEPLRPRLGPRLYGCDVCSQVCPHNGGPQPAVPSALRGAAWLPLTQLAAWAALSNRALRAALRGTAMSWLPPRIFLRSLAVVLGNVGLPAYAAPLSRLAEAHPDPMVREHARWALDRG